MRKKGIKFLLLVLIITVIAGVFSGCGNKSSENNTTGTSGSITAAGSSALQPLVEKAADQFKAKNPDATISVQGGGSGTGLTQVAQGAIDIGNSDIYANDKKGIDPSQLVDHKVAVVGFAIVTNTDVKVDNLTQAQLIDIFTGKVTNWKQVGGQDEKIVLINRPKSSGTRATFKKYGLNGKEEVEGIALTEDSSGAVKKIIETTKGSIGYLALSYLTGQDISGLKILKLNGVEPKKENIITNKYIIWSYEHMYTKGEPQGLAKTFLDYMTSNEVKPLVEKLGYIPVGDMKVQRD